MGDHDQGHPELPVDVSEQQLDALGGDGIEAGERLVTQEYVWWVGGYAQGVALPPDWCNNHWLNTRFGMQDRALEPGMFFNLENQFDVWEDWPGGSGAAYIETLMVTENGLEVMSKHPRTLVVV